jgi:N,N-dimethylformamidase beta subunit-like protein
MIAGGVLGTACLDRAVGPRAGNYTENFRPGSLTWTAGLAASSDSVISGYGLPISLVVGDTLHLFVAAQAGPVSLSIYRLGWYSGVGARLIAAHRRVPVSTQPPCSAAAPGPEVCDWAETDRFVVTPDWVPGLYLARFSDVYGRAQAFPFVVRSTQPAMFVVVLPFATYQAYNGYGGASLYGGAGATAAQRYANRAFKASFARPFSRQVVMGKALGTDYLLVRWLEQNGYDVGYITDFDFDAGGGRGADPPAVAWLFSGHSEYWTWGMWLRALAARDQGINLGFLGGNDIHWVARFESVAVHGLQAPVVVVYRDAALDPLGGIPGQATVHFWDPPNNTPANQLVGVMSLGKGVMRDAPIDLVVANGADPLLAGTGLATGDHIPRVAGWEGDHLVDNGLTPAGIRTLFDSPYVPAADTTVTVHTQATVYQWPASGALVFAAGEPGFSWGLSTFQRYTARPPLQRLLQNVLQAFVAARHSP